MPSRSDALVAAVRERLAGAYEGIFTEYFGPLPGRGTERSVKCIFHADRNPSCSVNIADGLYRCFNPECGASGDVFSLVQARESLSFPDALRRLAQRVGIDPDTYGVTYTPPRPRDPSEGGVPREVPPAPSDMPPIDDDIVLAFHVSLMAHEPRLRTLRDRRGLSHDTLVHFKVGHDNTRYTIPVRDESGAVRNIRRYDPMAREAHAKMISWRQGYGEARLFNLVALLDEDDDRPVLLCEGEMDAMLAWQYGFRAVTTTGGAGTWREAWNPLFAGKHVLIAYDCDNAGRSGARNVALQLSRHAASVRVVDLGLAEPVGADITDYFHGHGHTRADLEALIAATPPFATEAGTDEHPTSPDDDVTELHLSHASRAEFLHRRIRTTGQVSGKTTAPFVVPKGYTVRCTSSERGNLPLCVGCKLKDGEGSRAVNVREDTNALLKLIKVTDGGRTKQLRSVAGVTERCTQNVIDVTDPANIEEVIVIPAIDRTTRDAQYVTRVAYYLGHGLETNKTYTLTGHTMPVPTTQEVTHLFTSAVETRSSIDQFTLTPDTVERLRVFQPQDDTLESLDAKLDDIYRELERFTRIHQRRDLMLAVDLTFHSQLAFALQGEMLVRGWMELLVIGDTRTGKSTIVTRMSDYYQAGEMTSGENTSFSGIVGGLTQVGTTWALRWGKVPLNDRRLLIIDESGNLPTDQIARMSSLRSSGIAEVTKIHTERTNARSRQIWIANPRGNRPLSTYSHGVLAVKELIGAPEDVARFDLVVTCASDDVALAVVNARYTATDATPRYTSDLCHQRVMWAWSRAAEQVHITDDALDAILSHAMRHGEQFRYSSEIPIVEPNEQRVKLARLAVATATLFFSTDDTGTTVVVKPVHVDFAARYLDQLYAKPSLAFADYADAQRRRYTLTNLNAIASLIDRKVGAARALMEQEQFTQRDFAEIFGTDDRTLLREQVTMLRDSGFLRRQGSSFYYKTSAAIVWLRARLRDGAAPVAPDATFVAPPPAPTAPATVPDEAEEPLW